MTIWKFVSFSYKVSHFLLGTTENVIINLKEVMNHKGTDATIEKFKLLLNQ